MFLYIRKFYVTAKEYLQLLKTNFITELEILLFSSGLRAIRNPLFQFTFRFWYDLFVHNVNMTESLRNTNMSLIASTWLSEPYLQTKIFRDINTVFFTSIGWSTYYVVSKWSTQQPIIAGRRKRSSMPNLKFIEDILDEVHASIVHKLDSRMDSVEESELMLHERLFTRNYF